jgi:hypothetical protein
MRLSCEVAGQPVGQSLNLTALRRATNRRDPLHSLVSGVGKELLGDRRSHPAIPCGSRRSYDSTEGLPSSRDQPT